MGTDTGYVRLQEKTPVTEESFCSISWALEQISVTTEIPVMNQLSGELSEVSYYSCYLGSF